MLRTTINQTKSRKAKDMFKTRTETVTVLEEAISASGYFYKEKVRRERFVVTFTVGETKTIERVETQREVDTLHNRYKALLQERRDSRKISAINSSNDLLSEKEKADIQSRRNLKCRKAEKKRLNSMVGCYYRVGKDITFYSKNNKPLPIPWDDKESLVKYYYWHSNQKPPVEKFEAHSLVEQVIVRKHTTVAEVKVSKRKTEKVKTENWIIAIQPKVRLQGTDIVFDYPEFLSEISETSLKRMKVKTGLFKFKTKRVYIQRQPKTKTKSFNQIAKERKAKEKEIKKEGVRLSKQQPKKIKAIRNWWKQGMQTIKVSKPTANKRTSVTEMSADKKLRRHTDNIQNLINIKSIQG